MLYRFWYLSINIKTFFCSLYTLSNDPDDAALRQKSPQKVVEKRKGQRKTHNDATEVATAHDPSELAGCFKKTFWCLMCQQSFVCKTSWKKHQKVTTLGIWIPEPFEIRMFSSLDLEWYINLMAIWKLGKMSSFLMSKHLKPVRFTMGLPTAIQNLNTSDFGSPLKLEIQIQETSNNWTCISLSFEKQPITTLNFLI